ncbi:hypothetical protein [Streptomyces sp. NBC_00989]|uniref:hypothetical protein n=1 Tax=Streptomyces sp. NBC_00989 TaxID=2903705 RepID=UPI0038631BA7|nr:hypothetical protein OG714_47145 [Streptomyces sp. NBC_00989]
MTTSRVRGRSRAGFAARGVVYVLIGALAQVAARPLGKTVLWALVVGFGRMALWRGSRATLARSRPTPALELLRLGVGRVVRALVTASR